MSHEVDANKGVVIFFSREPVVRYRSRKTLKYRSCENIFCAICRSESDIWCICDVFESKFEFKIFWQNYSNVDIGGLGRWMVVLIIDTFLIDPIDVF
jgi:hypothetical protein